MAFSRPPWEGDFQKLWVRVGDLMAKKAIFLRIAVLTVSFITAVASAAGQVHDEARGRKVLESAIKALGGNAWLGARDLRTEGRAYQFSRYEELSGMAQVVTFERFPDRYRQELGKDKDIVFVLNGDKAWEGAPRGVATIPAEEVERIRLGRELSVDTILRTRMKEPGIEIAFTGTDLVDGRGVEIVEVLDSQNRTVTLAFDQTTHYPLRREWERRNPKTNEREQNVETLGKYVLLKKGGIFVPYYVRRERNGIKIFETFLTTAEINANLSDSLFHRPAGPDRVDPRSRR